MSINLANCSVLVTGAGKRIGYAIAKHLAQNFEVIIHYNNSASQAQKLADEIIGQGGKANVIQADLNNEAEVAGLIANAAELANRPITCLINNASIFQDETSLTTTKASFDDHMNINLWAPLKLSQDLALSLSKDNKGHIINIIDQRVLGVSTGFTSYTLSKVALHSLTKTMALELAPNIQVNAIAPGPILQSIHQSENDFAGEVAGLPLKQAATAEDIAKAVMFLLENNAITGEMITLDGGQHLT